MSSQILLRRGTSTAWTSANPLLAAGEPGYETDTGKFKIGDGTTQWNSLPYAAATDISELGDSSGLLFSGSYNDLTDKPVIPESILDLGIPDGIFGQVLTASGDGIFTFEDIPAQIVGIDDISEISITNPVSGNILKYNGVNWVNGDEESYELISSVAANEITLDLRVDELDNVSTVKIAAGENVSISQELDGTIVIDAVTDGSIFFDTTASPTLATQSGEDLTLKPATGNVILGAESSLAELITLTTQPESNLLIKPDLGRVIFGDRTGEDQVDNGTIDINFPVYVNTAGVTLSQGFENANAIPLRFVKSRGTITSPLPLQTNDVIGRIDFSGRANTQFNPSSAAIAALVGGTPSNTVVPTYLGFYSSDSSSTRLVSILSTNGLRVDNITSLTSNGDLNLNNNGSGKVRLPVGTTVGGVSIGLLNISGSVAAVGDLPAQPQPDGDAYLVGGDPDPAELYISDGANWINFGEFQGPPGQDGEDGIGIPLGGTDGQILFKVGETDGVSGWGNFPNADWTADTGPSVILNKPNIFSGSYSDLTDKPVFSAVTISGSYNDLLDTPAIPENIQDLNNVITTNPSVGQVLRYDGNFWVNSTVALGGASSLNDLSDTEILTPTTGQILKYDGESWINASEESAFRTIAVSGQDSVVADASTDTLTLVAGSGVTITTDANTDSITISATGGGGTSLGSRAALSGTSPSLADGAQGPIDIAEGYKTYALLKVQTSTAAWVRIYVSEAARQADAGRTEGTDPLPGAGVIAEVITTGAETVLITPGTIGFNNENPVTSNIPIRVTNLSGSTAAITVTLTAVQLEA